MWILVGLPGSGKTTWAKKMIEDYLNAGGAPEMLVRVSRDDCRNMLTVGYTVPQGDFERALTRMLNSVTVRWLEMGSGVISDETHLNPKWLKQKITLAERIGAQWKIIDLRDVPLETCIERDSRRDGSARVGEEVIRTMYDRYIAP